MTPTVPTALLERHAELEVLARAVGGAAAGRGAVVLVEGAAGIGKTSLLDVTRADAVRHGFRVLAARAGPLEREFAFGVVRDLVEPAVRAAFGEGAARLAAPVLDPAAGGGAPTFATLHGIFWLLADLTEEQPLLLAVDDAHWADAASLRALVHLARRVADLPLLVVVTARPAEPGAVADLLDALRGEPAVSVLAPGPLSADATSAIIRTTLGDPVAGAFGAACHEVAEGNPLLLGALLRSLREAGIAPTAENVAAVRARAPAIVAAFVLPLLRQLPEPAAAVARALAVLGPGAPLRHIAALAGLDAAAAARAVDRLVAAELVEPAPAFVHPLFGQAVAEHMTTAQRHAAHRSAARELAADGAPAEAIAAHLLRVEPLRDAGVVASLRRAARAALAKNAPRAAVTYLDRALAEPPPADQRVDVLFELGAAQTRLAPGAGTARLREALDLAADPARRDRIALELAESLELVSDLRRAVAVLERAVGDIERRGPGDADAALRLETELIAVTRADPVTQASAGRRFERLRHRARPDTAPGCVLLAALATELLQDPDRTAEAVALAEQALSGAVVTDPGRLLVGALYPAGWVLVAAGELDRAAVAADRAVEAVRGRSSPVELGAVLHFRADVALRRGAVLDAEADARFAQDLAAQVDLRPSPRRDLLGDLLDALVERGRPDEAERELAVLGLPGGDHRSQLGAALGRLRLAQGRPAEALGHSLACGARMERRGWHHPGLFTWRTDAALAAHLLGDGERARCLTAEAVGEARRFAAPIALGVALRASGLVTGDLDLLREGVATLAPTPARLEHARALVELGAGLRRANRRTAAREPLRDGLDLATRCGATALADRAVEELTATGARPRRSRRTGVEALSPSERRVARLAAQGLSNRDIAQALFVTTKTVEVHLSACYRKLAISSRADLPALFPPG